MLEAYRRAIGCSKVTGNSLTLLDRELAASPACAIGKIGVTNARLTTPRMAPKE
jgi:hypothetical protein